MLGDIIDMPLCISRHGLGRPALAISSTRPISSTSRAPRLCRQRTMACARPSLSGRPPSYVPSACSTALAAPTWTHVLPGRHALGQRVVCSSSPWDVRLLSDPPTAKEACEAIDQVWDPRSKDMDQQWLNHIAKFIVRQNIEDSQSGALDRPENGGTYEVPSRTIGECMIYTSTLR